MNLQDQVLEKVDYYLEERKYEKAMLEVKRANSRIKEMKDHIQKSHFEHFMYSLKLIKAWIMISTKEYSGAIELMKEILERGGEGRQKADLWSSLKLYLRRKLKDIGTILSSFNEFDFKQNIKDPFQYKIFYPTTPQKDIRISTKMTLTPERLVENPKFEKLSIPVSPDHLPLTLSRLKTDPKAT